MFLLYDLKLIPRSRCEGISFMLMVSDLSLGDIGVRELRCVLKSIVPHRGCSNLVSITQRSTYIQLMFHVFSRVSPPYCRTNTLFHGVMTERAILHIHRQCLISRQRIDYYSHQCL